MRKICLTRRCDRAFSCELAVDELAGVHLKRQYFQKRPRKGSGMIKERQLNDQGSTAAVGGQGKVAQRQLDVNERQDSGSGIPRAAVGGQ